MPTKTVTYSKKRIAEIVKTIARSRGFVASPAFIRKVTNVLDPMRRVTPRQIAGYQGSKLQEDDVIFHLERLVAAEEIAQKTPHAVSTYFGPSVVWTAWATGYCQAEMTEATRLNGALA